MKQSFNCDNPYHPAGPLATKHRQIVNKNPMFSGLHVPSTASQSNSLANKLSHWSTESLSFLKSCLEMEPEKRLSCSLLLKAVLFTHDNFHITFPPQLQSKLQVSVKLENLS